MEDECKKYENLAAEALQNLKECRGQRRKLADEIRELNKRIKKLIVDIPKLSMEVSGCDTTREELNKRLPDLKAQCTLSQSDSAKLVELNAKVTKCKTDMSSCALLAEELESEVRRLQKAILDAGGSKLKKQQKLCDKTLKDLNETTKKLNSTKVQLNSLRKAIQKAKKAKDVFTEELEKSKALLEEKKEDFKKIEGEALQVMEAYEEVQAIEAEKKEALVNASKECEVLKKSQSNIKCIEVEMMSKLDNCDKAIHEHVKRIKHWEDQIARVCNSEDQDNNYDLCDEEFSDEDEDESEQSKEDESEDQETSTSGCVRVRETPLPVFNETALRQYDRDEVKQDIGTLERERDSIAKNANMAAIAEYKKKENDYLAR